MVRRRTTNTGVVELKNKEDKAPSYADEDARVFDEEGNALIADSKAWNTLIADSKAWNALIADSKAWNAPFEKH